MDKQLSGYQKTLKIPKLLPMLNNKEKQQNYDQREKKKKKLESIIFETKVTKNAMKDA